MYCHFFHSFICPVGRACGMLYRKQIWNHSKPNGIDFMTVSRKRKGNYKLFLKQTISSFCKSAPCKDCLPLPIWTKRPKEKQTHLIFFSSGFEKSCEVDLSLECQYFPFPIFSDFENSPTGPLTTTLTFPASFFGCLGSSVPIFHD